MKKIVWIICLMLLACGGNGVNSGEPFITTQYEDPSVIVITKPVDPVPTQPEVIHTYLFMGDSITYGTFVQPDECYVSLLKPMLKNSNLINKGVPGQLSFEGADVIEKYIIEYKPKIVSIYYGTNDIGFYSTKTIMESLEYMVDISILHGSIPVIVTLGAFIGDWSWRATYAIDLNNEIRKLAKEKNIALVDLEPALNWNPNLMVMPDGEHPNAAGHKVMAEEFFKILCKL